MSVVVDIQSVRARMKAMGLDVTGLAQRAGLSRQALYRFLREGYCPFSAGFVSVSEVLGVSPVVLLKTDTADVTWVGVMEHVHQAAAGEARAFEVLPALLVRAARGGKERRDELPEPGHRLLAAAGEVAHALRGARGLELFVRYHAMRCAPGQAFFFGARYMSTERIVEDTPEAMKKHLVFGAFRMADFERHFDSC